MPRLRPPQSIHFGFAMMLAIAISALPGCASESRRSGPPPQFDTNIACSESPAQPSTANANADYEKSQTSIDAPATTAAPLPPIELNPLDNFHMIADNRAYRSAQLPAEKLDYVCRTFGIKTVINLRGPNPRHEWYQQEKAACESIGVKLVDISWSASHLPPRDRLLALFDAFKSETGPLLIHCSAGADRTGAASAIYRMVVLGHDRETASKELSFRYGHFRIATPKMDELVEMFQPSREWIEREYSPPE